MWTKEYKREYLKNWRKSNKDKVRRYDKKYLQKYPWAKAFRNISCRCSGKNHWYYKKGIKNYLTTLGVKFLWFRDKAYLMKQPTIDRINGYKHYILDNCRFIEFDENRRRPKCKEVKDV